MTIPQDNNEPVIKEVSEEKLGNQRVNISIDVEVMKILKAERMDINQLFVLLAMYNEHLGLLDIYDSNSTSFKVMLVDYQTLQFHGFIMDSDSTKLYELTPKGKEFVEKIKPLMDLEEDEKMNEAVLKQLCSDYLLLFPKIKLPSGKYARTNVVEIEKKMRNWIKTYKPVFKKDGIKLTNDIILEATKNYVTRYTKDNYRFMVTSSYFIQKNEKSALADEIQAVKDGLNVKAKTNIVTM